MSRIQEIEWKVSDKHDNVVDRQDTLWLISRVKALTDLAKTLIDQVEADISGPYDEKMIAEYRAILADD